MPDFDELRWRPDDTPHLGPDELDAELGHVLGRGRRQKARRRAAMAGSLAVASLVVVMAAAVAMRGPDEESGVRAADQQAGTSTSTTAATPDAGAVPTTVEPPDTTVPALPRPAFAVVVRHREDPERPDEPFNELVMVDGTTGKDLRTIFRAPFGAINSPTLSPDGKYVYFVIDSCGWSPVVRARVDGPADQKQETVTEMTGYYPAISPDGRSLAYFGVRGCDDTESNEPEFSLRVRDLASGQERVVAVGPENYSMTDVDWSPDGKSLALGVSRHASTSETASAQREGFVAVLDAGKQEDVLKARRLTSARAGLGFMSPSYLPDGNLFVIETPLDNDQRSAPMMLVVDATTGRTVRTVATGDPKRFYGSTDVDPTGAHLLYISRPRGVGAPEVRVSSNGARTTVLTTGTEEATW